jgi:hypothetical protein
MAQVAITRSPYQSYVHFHTNVHFTVILNQSNSMRSNVTRQALSTQMMVTNHILVRIRRLNFLINNLIGFSFSIGQELT